MTTRDQDRELAYESCRSLMCNVLLDSKFDWSHSNTGQSLDMCMLCKPAPACRLFPSETPRLMLFVKAFSKPLTSSRPARKTRQISEQTVETIVDDALELDTLLSGDVLPVRLRISGNVVRFELEVGAKTQEASKHIVHDVLSLFILSGVVPVNGNLTEARGLREDVGDEHGALAK
jgi:hypothetical protein